MMCKLSLSNMKPRSLTFIENFVRKHGCTKKQSYTFQIQKEASNRHNALEDKNVWGHYM